MDLFKKHWRKTPVHFRRPVVLLIGILVLLASAAISWLPGPGGIPLFLLAIAILATEYRWASRVRDGILGLLNRTYHWLVAHPQLAFIIIGAFIWMWAILLYLAFGR